MCSWNYRGRRLWSLYWGTAYRLHDVCVELSRPRFNFVVAACRLYFHGFRVELVHHLLLIFFDLRPYRFVPANTHSCASLLADEADYSGRRLVRTLRVFVSISAVCAREGRLHQLCTRMRYPRAEKTVPILAILDFRFVLDAHSLTLRPQLFLP